MINAFFFVCLLTILSFTLFSIDTNVPQGRIPAAFLLLLTTMSFKWTLTSVLPTISYSTSLDRYIVACICFQCLEILWHSVVSVLDVSSASQFDALLLIDFAALFVVIHLILAVWFYFAYDKVRKFKREEAVHHYD